MNRREQWQVLNSLIKLILTKGIMIRQGSGPLQKSRGSILAGPVL